MWDGLKKSWAALIASAPGDRFQERYRRNRRARGERTGLMVLVRGAIAVVLALLGALMLVTPGPGILLLAVAAAVFASESLAVARFLDRTELRVRRVLHALRR